MKRKIQRSNSLVLMLKTLAVIMVLISCGCGGDPPSGPPKQWPKNEQPKVPTGSGGMDKYGNPVK